VQLSEKDHRSIMGESQGIRSDRVIQDKHTLPG
jgi:hypothetical protein